MGYFFCGVGGSLFFNFVTIAILNGLSTAVFFLIIKISCLKSHLIPSMYMQVYIKINYRARWVSFWQEKCSQSELSFLKFKLCHCWVGEAKGFDQGHKPITGTVQPMAGPGNASSQSKVRRTVDATCRHLAPMGSGSAYLSCLLLHLMRR